MRKVVTIKNADKQFAEIYGKGSNKLYAQDAKIISERISAVASDAKQSAEEARQYADSAQHSADNANEYASQALMGLSTVQRVAETLTWITQHGTMTNTQALVPPETELDPSHVYFILDNPDGQYVVGGVHYTLVTEPNVDDIASYYILSVDESISNYVMTHLALTDDGLWILSDEDTDYRVLIAPTATLDYPTAGLYIIDGSNNIVAMFGTEMTSYIQVANNYVTYADETEVTAPNTAVTFSETELGADSEFIRLDANINGQPVTIDPQYYSYAFWQDEVSITLNDDPDGQAYIISKMVVEGSDPVAYYPCTMTATYTIERHNDTGTLLNGRTRVIASGSDIFDILNDWRDQTPSTANTIQFRTIDENGDETSMTVGIGSGGINKGLWDVNNNRWMIYTNSNGDTIINGDVVRINGSSVVLSGHSSRVGASVTKNQASVTVYSKSTFDDSCKSTAYIQLSKGDWLLMLGVGFPNDPTGVRRIGIGTTSELVNVTRQSDSNPNNNAIYLESTLDVHPTANTNYYAYIFQNTGSNMSVNIYWRAIRIA